MHWQDYIAVDPAVMTGKPVIKGTRITVELILERLGDGWTEAELLNAYPHLKAEHVRAAQAYAAASLSSEEVIFFGDVS